MLMLPIQNEAVNFLIIFAGAAWRTIRPWMKKYKAYINACEQAQDEGKPEPLPSEFGMRRHGVQFNKNFLLSAAFSFLSILVIAALIGALQSPSQQSGFPLFMWATGQTEVINREIL